MGDYLYLVSLKCGRFDKKFPIKGMSKDEIEEFKNDLCYDKKRFIAIVR